MSDRLKIKILIIFIPSFTLLCAILVFWGTNILTKKHHEEIHKIIQLEGGEVKEISKVSVEESPFEKSSAHNIIYKIDYLENGQLKTAWYRGTNVVNNIHSYGRGGLPEEWILDE